MADKLQVRDPISEFYILDINNTLRENSIDIVENQPVLLNVGIVNHEGIERYYQIFVSVDDKVIMSLSDIIILADSEKMEQPIKFSLKNLGDNQKVNILLWKLGSSFPYRRLALFVNVKPPS